MKNNIDLVPTVSSFRIPLSRLQILAVFGVLTIVSGFYLYRDVLVAAGLASVIFAVLPCIAMCGLGLCMGGGKASTCTRADAEDATSSKYKEE